MPAETTLFYMIPDPIKILKADLEEIDLTDNLAEIVTQNAIPSSNKLPS